MVVLAGPHLVEYLVFERSALGKPRHYAYHRARFVLDLADCYIFSGELCEQILERGARASERMKDPDNPAEGSKSKIGPQSLIPWGNESSSDEEDLGRHEIRRRAKQRPKSIVQKRHGPTWDPDHAELAFLGSNSHAKVYSDGLRATAGQADCCFIVWQKQGPPMELGSNHRMRIYRARSKVRCSDVLDRLIGLIRMRGGRRLSATSGFGRFRCSSTRSTIATAIAKRLSATSRSSRLPSFLVPLSRIVRYALHDTLAPAQCTRNEGVESTLQVLCA